MRLSNASYGYFGLFLSQAMARLGHLGTLYTNLPWTRLRDLPRHSRRSQPLFAGPIILSHMGLRALATRIEPMTVRLFSEWVGRSLGKCDVFHCFSTFGLEAFRAAREKTDALTVVERGSSHIRVQNELLVEEYARCGVPFAGVNPWAIEREEAEYSICDRITVQSSFAEQTFLERGVPAEKLIKLPLGVDLSMFRPVRKADSVFRVLYAGNCSIRKGVRYLLEAVSNLKLPNVEIVLNGSIHPEIADFMKQHSGTFRFTGFQPLERVHEVYSQASVLVLPTIEDGFGKVVTEAMACGIPVIATPNCGAPDVIDDGVEGFIVPIRNSQAIREKILYLYENPDVREAMGQAALARVESLASWEVYGEQAVRAYQQALEEAHGV